MSNEKAMYQSIIVHFSIFRWVIKLRIESLLYAWILMILYSRRYNLKTKVGSHYVFSFDHFIWTFEEIGNILIYTMHFMTTTNEGYKTDYELTSW